MDLTLYKEAIRTTMGVLITDATSTLKSVDGSIKTYLETNTSITDNERANIYMKFITDVTTTAITQTIDASVRMALEGEIKDQKLLNMQGELVIAQDKGRSDTAVNTQKIASMRNEDNARQNEVAVKVAKAKIEVEQLIPSEIALNQKELAIKDKSLELETKRLDLMTQEIAVKKEQIRLSDAEIKLKYADIYYRQQQAKTVARSLIVNERIEAAKNETALKVATIQAASL